MVLCGGTTCTATVSRLAVTAAGRIRLDAAPGDNAVKGVVDLRKLIICLATHRVNNRLSAKSLNLIRLIGDLLLINRSESFADELSIRVSLLSDEIDTSTIFTSVFPLLETGLTAAALQRIATGHTTPIAAKSIVFADKITADTTNDRAPQGAPTIRRMACAISSLT